MQAVFNVLIPIIVEAAKIGFFIALTSTGIKILLRAASGRDTWMK